MKAATFLAVALMVSITVPRDGTLLDDLKYLSDGNPNHVLDAYLPSGPGTFPVAIVIHGQPSGDEDAVAGFAKTFQDTAFVGIAGDCRHWSKPVWPAQLEDLHAAIDWIRSHAGLLKADPSRITVLGVSLGGFAAAMLATGAAAYRPDAVATWSGKLDLTTYKVANGLILGSQNAKIEKVLVANSPTLRVPTYGAVPWFIANSKCEIVPLSQATGMGAALAAKHIPYQLKIVQLCLHGGGYGYLVSADNVAFFEQYTR